MLTDQWCDVFFLLPESFLYGAAAMFYVLGSVFLAEKMHVTAEAVSATLTTCRNCTIEITNISEHYCLINPK